jgi:hypothetical protein
MDIDKCENRNNKKKTAVKPSANLVSYIPAKITNPSRMKLPIAVLNRLTNRLGIANMINQSTINNVINPTSKFIFFEENNSANDIYNI